MHAGRLAPCVPGRALACPPTLLLCACNARPGSSVLSLDDDILMPCSTVEAAFAAWRSAPQRLLGFYPRLLLPEQPGGPPTYQFEEIVFQKASSLLMWQRPPVDLPCGLWQTMPAPPLCDGAPPVFLLLAGLRNCSARTTRSSPAPPSCTPTPSSRSTPPTRSPPRAPWWTRCSTAMVGGRQLLGRACMPMMAPPRGEGRESTADCVQQPGASGPGGLAPLYLAASTTTLLVPRPCRRPAAELCGSQLDGAQRGGAAGAGAAGAPAPAAGPEQAQRRG